MSSTTDAFPWPLPTTVLEGSTTDEDSGPGGMTRGANYFFGFLITFVVLLLLFVACGLAARRRLLARRQVLLVGRRGDPWVFGYQGPPGEEGENVEPVWVERWTEKGDGEGWKGIMPLSTSVVRPDAEVEREDANANGQEREMTGRGSPTSTTARRASFFSVSSWLSTTKETTLLTELLDSNAEVDVAVMVAMPRRSKIHGAPEYEFGVTRVPLRGPP
ncbi:hypothetical protein FPV67DRAFT_1669149 [Lyophyllum atratum]|nr:hypothetical protein FPV67DRAFT_1669149 [Lyophyllum atratum]